MRRTHINSVAAFHDLELGEIQETIYEIFKADRRPLTDRQVLRMFMHGRQGDMNKVRPRINELLNMKNTPIKDIGSRKCPTTGINVRVCMYLPMDQKQDDFKVDSKKGGA